MTGRTQTSRRPITVRLYAIKLRQSNPRLGSEEPEVSDRILVTLRNSRMGLKQLSQLLRGLLEIITGQHVTQRQKRQQPNYRDNDYHDDHAWITEAFARNHECCSDVALPGTEGECPSGIDPRSPKHPAHAEAECNQ